MSNTHVMDVRAPSGIRLHSRWYRRPVKHFKGTVGELRKVLPHFQRRGGQIVRDSPWKAGEEFVVGKVSPEYVLIQHEDLLDALPKVMSSAGYDIEGLYGELIMTTCGERVELQVYLPAVTETPLDGYPLECRLRCINSVDGSTALGAELQWYRKICSNGMFGWSGHRIRHIHRFGNVLNWMSDRLAVQFALLPKDRFFFTEMIGKAVSEPVLRQWVDVLVARNWGWDAAARTYHICMTGRDGVISNLSGYRWPHQVELESTFDVPGACAPTRNVYHVGQALSWVAGHAEKLETRFSHTSAIPKLLEHLMN